MTSLIGFLSHRENNNNNNNAGRWSWSEKSVAALRSSLVDSLRLFTEEYAQGKPIDDLWHEWRGIVVTDAKRSCYIRQQQRKRPIWQARPWMTPDLVNEINSKHKAFRSYLKDRTPENWRTFASQRNRVTQLLRDAKSTFITDHLHRNTQATESFSTPKLNTIMRCLTKPKKRAIPDLQHDQNVLTEPSAKAEALNTFFISQSRQSVEGVDRATVPPIHYPPVTESLSYFSTTPDKVAALLKGLDPTKSAGDDGVPTRLLKEAADQLAPSLAILFNTSFQQCAVPQDWKDATITPAFKKGDPSQLTNYRPISLLSVLSKVQERIAYEHLYEHINPHLPKSQSGFRSNDGTELQLARLLHHVMAERNSGKTVLSCFFDLSKAFDRVWHRGLLAKLAHLGVSGNAHSWLVDYLRHRRQRVRISNQYSSWLDIPAGVPQGSVLGPLLFLAYTVDLPASCANETTICSQFADDTALVTSASSLDAAEQDLQQAVTSAGTWLKAWHLLVNPTKTVILPFHHPNRPLSHIPNIVLHETCLSVVSQHKHLGLIISSDLRWHSYIDHIIQKSLKKLRFFHRIRGAITSSALCFLYKTYVRPIIEYASLAYCNLSATLSDKLERLQRKAARICLRIPLFTPVHHSSILHLLHLPTLQSRRNVKLALLGHSIHYQYAPPHVLGISLPLHSIHNYSLRHSHIYSLPKARTDRYLHSPINSSLTIFDALPADYRAVPARAQFKSTIEQYLISSVCSCSSHPAVL